MLQNKIFNIIKDSFPDLNLEYGLSPIIGQEKLQDFPNHPHDQSQIDDGYFDLLSDKAEILKKILDALGLDLRITYSCND